MRSFKSFRNMFFSVLSNAITILIGFVIQATFLKFLGSEYLGINGLFTNIVTMLAIVDLGIGTAIIYNLYKPVDEGNIEKIKSLMDFYRKSYVRISIAVLAVGLLIVPFLDIIVGTNSITDSIYVIYALFLLDASLSYVLSYKRSILYADQKNYIMSIIHIIYLFVMNSLLLIILYKTQNYLLFMATKIAMRFLENLAIYIVADKRYPYLREKNVRPLDKKTKDDIFVKVRGLIYHKVGYFISSGSDNIIISLFLGGVKTVGYYVNYHTIIFAVITMIGQAFSAITSSIGNMLVNSKKNKKYEVYEKINFLNFWIAGFCATCIFVIMESFIKIWIGHEYLLATSVLLVLTINCYFTIARNTMNSFKEASGIFHEDRFVPFIESGVNIISSIILLKMFGLAGVFMGSILGVLVLHLYSYPKYIYCPLFDRKYSDYIKNFIRYFCIFIVGLGLTYSVSLLIVVDNNILQVLVNVIICGVVVNLFYILLFYKSREFKYFKCLVGKMKNKVLKVDK